MASIRKQQGSNKLFFDFRYQGQRCREYTLIEDTLGNFRWPLLGKLILFRRSLIAHSGAMVQFKA